jgi:transmembrane sensor
MQYEKFEAADLAMDAAFIRWVKKPDTENDRFWEQMQQQHPQMSVHVQAARTMVQAVEFQQFMPTDAQVEAIQSNIQRQIGVRQPRQLRIVRGGLLYWAVAACLTGLFAVAAWFWLLRTNESPQYATQFGETKQISLADGTSVVLNGNSKLRVDSDNNREVWLEGEALFVVTKSEQQKFVVHTGQQVDIQVLGTTFNVDTRRENLSVTLQEGKVQLIPETGEKVTMNPGDLATYNRVAKKVNVRQIKPEQANAWTKGELVLDNMTLQMIVDYLYDTYQVRIAVTDQSLLSEQLIGTISLKNVDEFIENIALTLDLQVEKDSKGQYVLKSN